MKSTLKFGLILTYWHEEGKVGKSQKQNWRKKLLPKMNGQICFSILTVRNYLKLEILIASFKLFRTVRIEKQICPFIFGRNFFRQFCFWDLLTFRWPIIWPYVMKFPSCPCPEKIDFISHTCHRKQSGKRKGLSNQVNRKSRLDNFEEKQFSISVVLGSIHIWRQMSFGHFFTT